MKPIFECGAYYLIKFLFWLDAMKVLSGIKKKDERIQQYTDQQQYNVRLDITDIKDNEESMDDFIETSMKSLAEKAKQHPGLVSFQCEMADDSINNRTWLKHDGIYYKYTEFYGYSFKNDSDQIMAEIVIFLGKPKEAK